MVNSSTSDSKPARGAAVGLALVLLAVQAGVVAQRRSGVLGPGDALPLQDRHHVVDERVELAGQHVGHDRKPVGSAGLPPLGHESGHALGSSGVVQPAGQRGCDADVHHFQFDAARPRQTIDRRASAQKIQHHLRGHFLWIRADPFRANSVVARE